MRDDYLKPNIESRVDEFNRKLKERLEDGNLQINSYVDGKFDLILTDEDLSGNLGVNYYSGVMPTDDEYDGMVVKGRPNDKDEVIDKYLNMNLIFDVRTNSERCGTAVKVPPGT